MEIRLNSSEYNDVYYINHNDLVFAIYLYVFTINSHFWRTKNESGSNFLIARDNLQFKY